MYDLAVLWDFLSFAVRWLHVVTAMAWIGASFYFIALDLGLRRAPDLPEGASGEEWEVHGGGFYNTVKYTVAPDRLPEHLTWHKWQSYMTWISGAGLLMIVYWAGAELFLVDPQKLPLATWQAVALSAAFIAAGWLGYDALCRSPLRHRPTLVMAVLFAGIVLSSWLLHQTFTGRAAQLHLGAMTATIMTANVFFVIMPNQRVVVGDLKAGRTPAAEYGAIAKLRSTHNNYLTLPVIFLMLSNHYPTAFAVPGAWLMGPIVFVIGVLVRHYFNTLHATGHGPVWTWGAAATAFVLVAWLGAAPLWRAEAIDAAWDRPLTAAEAAFAQAPGFDAAAQAVQGRCAMCHAREPVWDGIRWPPKGVVLETDADVARHAREVHLQAGASHAMPPGNLSDMTDAERADIRAWWRAASGGAPVALR